MAEITEVDACLTGDGSSLKDHESDERIGQPGLVDEPWKDEDGVVCDPEHMKKWSFARKDTQRMGPITKGKMCFGAKGVKKMERIGTNALSLHLPCDRKVDAFYVIKKLLNSVPGRLSSTVTNLEFLAI